MTNDTTPSLAPALAGDGHAAAITALRATASDRLMTACRLARFYGCAPGAFLELEPEALSCIVETTITLMNDEDADD